MLKFLEDWNPKISYFSREITVLVGVCEWNRQTDTKQKRIEVHLAGILAAIPDTLTEVSRCFPQSLQEYAGLIPRLGKGHFLSEPSTSFFTIAQSSDCTVNYRASPLALPCTCRTGSQESVCDCRNFTETFCNLEQILFGLILISQP